MNIVVCVKQVPDNKLLSYDINTNSIQNLYYVINSRDEVAVEEAIRIKSKMGYGNVWVVTVGPPRAERVLRRCLAIGADKAIHIYDSAFENIDAYGVSVVLAKAISTLDYSLVLCGLKSDDEGNSFVGACIAELLGIPYVSGVVKLEIFPVNNKVSVYRRLEKGDMEVVESPLPAVLAVERGMNQPRYVSIYKQMSALNREIIKLDATALNINLDSIKPMTKCLAISQPRPRLKKGFTIDSSLEASERINLILSGGFQKKERIIEKRPRESASELIKFLIDNKII
jgi:electron transfer flavoprotein beta subunit